VVFRRSIPTLTAVSLIVGSLLLPRFTAEEHAGLFMALHYVPIAVLAIAFKIQELARFEIPRPPRRPTAATWLRAAAAEDADRSREQDRNGFVFGALGSALSRAWAMPAGISRRLRGGGRTPSAVSAVASRDRAPDRRDAQ
jgi:hypothetical protein